MAIEEGCGLPAQSLLHPDGGRNLRINPISVQVTYLQFSCVMDGIDKAGLSGRGTRVLLVGGDAKR